MTERSSHDRLPAEVRDVLDDLRGRIRRYVLIEGVSLVLVVLAALFWASYLADWGGWSDDMQIHVTTGVYLFRLTVDGQRFAGKMLARRPPQDSP